MQTQLNNTNVTPGQTAYERDLTKMPIYPSGEPRKPWGELDEVTQSIWENSPATRTYLNARQVFTEFDFSAVPDINRRSLEQFVKSMSEIGEHLIRKKTGEVAILVNRKVIWLSTDEKNNLVICMSKEPVEFVRDSMLFDGEFIQVKSFASLEGVQYQDDMWAIRQWLATRVSVPLSEKRLRNTGAKPH